MDMEQFIGNPGLDHIAEKIFLTLDHGTLLCVQCVCRSWHHFLKFNAKFWLKKCVQDGIPEWYQMKWTKLIRKAFQNRQLELKLAGKS